METYVIVSIFGLSFLVLIFFIFQTEESRFEFKGFSEYILDKEELESERKNREKILKQYQIQTEEDLKTLEKNLKELNDTLNDQPLNLQL